MTLCTGQVQIGDEDRGTLVSWTRSSSVRAGLALRAKIVLAADAGEGTSAISRRLGVSRPTVIQWRDRFAALEVATGKIIDSCYDRHGKAEFLDFLKKVALHFTPTSGSWLNLVEVFFGIITRHAIRRGTFTSVKDLVAAITRFIDGWNERCHPFTWTKPADEILPHALRQPTSETRR